MPIEMQKDKLLELKDFIKKNSYWIFDYINSEVLKDVGIMHPDYFIQVMKEVFIENPPLETCEKNTTTNMLPYFIFTQVSQKGTIAYTSLRVETIDFKQLDIEARAYYNYARFSIKEDCLCIELMQSKIGGMPIDGDIVKFTKNIPINPTGLEEFILEKEKDVDLIASKEEYKKIKEAINNIF